MRNSLFMLIVSCLIMAAVPADTLFADEVTIIKTGLKNLRYLTRFGNLLYFDADSALWKSEGSEEETVQVKTGLSGISHWGLSAVGAQLFFATDDETIGMGALWKSDGTGDGTGMVDGYSNINRITGMANVNGTLFFANDTGGEAPLDPSRTSTLYKTDGITSTVVKSGLSGRIKGLTGMEGIAYFTVYHTDGYSLWKSDGTSDGTVLVKENFSNNIAYWQLTQSGSSMFFTTYSGSDSDSDINGSDFALWKTDGTAAGTVVTKDGFGRNIITNLTDVNDTLFFSTFNASDDASYCKLWKSDGTETGTTALQEQLDDVVPGDMTAFENMLYMAEYDDSNQQSRLWKSDGTSEGTVVVKEGLEQVHDLTAVNSTLYFSAYDYFANFKKISSKGLSVRATSDADRSLGKYLPDSSSGPQPQTPSDSKAMPYLFLLLDGTTPGD